MVDTAGVIYNIFEQALEDTLFRLCRELEIAVIARLPFDEGTLTGTLTLDSRWPSGDWRNRYAYWVGAQDGDVAVLFSGSNQLFVLEISE
jgi:aryl-alcohol dehydrogenase-like predicted oxidoreductase